ncbi:MAG TPA: 3-dehydro-L-gulonate 2-dehydrogenase [Flavisolibacter sp.]|nr:3-dehydro-L-gulonate 2-dehydrogenase [Flavisolibacter sp.]
MTDTLYISFDEMKTVFRSILLQHDFSDDKAETCAGIFATNSLDGVYSHGVNRFALFVKMVKDGHVLPNAEPFLRHVAPTLEQWDGALGAGVLNAAMATDRAVQIAKKNGLGCVALANTNHWMRGGYYGWRAASAGCVFIGWSNTIANMPAYGATDVRLGNNPLVIAVPFGDEAIVLDMAMSQFSYGAMQMAAMKGEVLPVYGGYDEQGQLSTDASVIMKTGRTLSIGYWKGAGLSLLLDIVGAVLSGGKAVYQISEQTVEKGLSQVFFAVDAEHLQNFAGIENSIQAIVADYKKSAGEGEILFPGERVMKKRKENLVQGIPVLKEVWEEILSIQ